MRRSFTLRWRITSAIVPILRPCALAKASSSGMRAMEPSGFMISQITAAGVSPAASARSHPASVCPARTSTPPFCAITGKMWPGWTMSLAFACFAVAARTVRARSAAEIPVLTPVAASMETVNAVPMGERLSFTMSGRLRLRHFSSVSVRQIRPRACMAMKLMASGVTKSAASTRSPSFSRSSASARTTMRPWRSSSTKSWVVSRVMESSSGKTSILPACRGRSAFVEQALHVAGQHVHFEVHWRAGREVAQRRHGPRVGNDVHLEGGALDRIHGKAHAVHRDRAFLRDVLRERRRHLDRQAHAPAQVLESQHAAHAIHVTRHEMPVDAVGEPQRLLEIHFTPLFEARGHVERGARRFHVERARVLRDHRVADALDRDRVADPHLIEAEVLHGDAMAKPVARCLRRLDLPHVGHDAREHQRTSLAVMRQSSPTAVTSVTRSLRASESSVISGSAKSPIPLSPMSFGARYSTSSSTTPAMMSEPFNLAPVSTVTSLNLRSPRSFATAARSLLPSPGTRTTSAPRASSAWRRFASSLTVKMRGGSPFRIFASSGMSRRLSMTTRFGWREQGTWRTVSP